MTDRSRIGETVMDGDAVIVCPNCGAEVRTVNALIRFPIEHGMHYQGVPCTGCSATFTVELTETPK